ncbi:MAG TPA: hypothetical protein VG714_07200 [Acidobacteriaceae bacterium]|nr:hypothetical protein [Acidobacteriaceae bacterium]
MREVRNLTDYLIMLLSTDWFLPYWAEIGIHVEDQAKKVRIQRGCRGIVDQMLSGSKDYYQRQDSPDRKRETASEFLTLLRDCDAETEVSEASEEWSNLSHEKLYPAFMYWGHTIDLIQGRVQERGLPLSPSIKEEVVKAWEACQMAEPDFPEICLNSKSTWDTYTQTLLTNAKTLANILNSVLRERNFRAFWTHLRQQLTPHQLNELASWYRAMTVNKLHEDRSDVIPSYIS